MLIVLRGIYPQLLQNKFPVSSLYQHFSSICSLRLLFNCWSLAKILLFLFTFLFHYPLIFFHCLPFSYVYLTYALQPHKNIVYKQKVPFVDWAANLHSIFLSPSPRPPSHCVRRPKVRRWWVLACAHTVQLHHELCRQSSGNQEPCTSL